MEYMVRHLVVFLQNFEQNYNIFLKNGPTPASFCLFSFFSDTTLTEKTEDVSGIRTRIVGIEGKYTDHHDGPYIIKYRVALQLQ